MNTPSEIELLCQLASLYGVLTEYYDVAGQRQQATVESLLAVLRCLGAPLATLRDVPSAWRERQQSRWRQPIEPVAVAWEGEPFTMKVRLPSSLAEASLNCHLTLEGGDTMGWQWRGATLPTIETAEVEGTYYVVKPLHFPERLPWGYHQFVLEIPGGLADTLIIAAPVRTYAPTAEGKDRTWGVFLPLYALHTHKSWGSGDFSDLEALIAWVAGVGGRFVATLPLLATFLDGNFEPSPYAPASRLLWNEFYLDVEKIPELPKCTAAQELMASPSFQKELKTLRSLPLVDYRQQMTLKRHVLEELSRFCFAEASDRLEALRRFAQTNQVAEDYACFRAAYEKYRSSWQTWSLPLREGVLKAGDYDEETKRYYLYGQWLAHQQIQALAEGARQKGVELYFDLPLGVHPDGYDVWRNQDLFALEASAGAPPDTFFNQGQNWAFPPLHPERLRQQKYAHYIACLRHHLKHAGALRIDHVMGFHRLFWIPKGLDARQGVYVRYTPEEFYAILALESHRNKAIIVGEDLGTVPPEVRVAMARHGLQRMYVAQFELTGNAEAALQPIATDVVAGLNTHDIPTFAAFWQRLDIKERLRLSLLNEMSAQKEQGARRMIKEALVSFLQRNGWLKGSSVDTPAVLRACLGFLSASPARMVLVNLEDLWLETQPQNIPGTWQEYPNWRRKAAYPLEVFCQMPEVRDTLQGVNNLRKQG